jgi:hypothetical protein
MCSLAGKKSQTGTLRSDLHHHHQITELSHSINAIGS